MTEIKDIPLSLIYPSPFQMRSSMDPQALDQLAESLRRDGQQRPVKVRPLPDGDYELVFGHRTLEAAKLAGKTAVQAIVEDLGDEDVMWAQHAENECREDVSDYDLARWLKTMIDQFGHIQTELAEKIGQDQPWVSRHLAILKLEGIMSRDIIGKITEGQARVILSAPNEILPDVCKEIEQFYEENGDLPSASTIRDIIDWKSRDLEETIPISAGTPEPTEVSPPGTGRETAEEAPAPLTEEEKHERIEQLRKRVNESTEPLQDAYREIHPYATYVGTSVMRVSDLRKVLKNHPELYEAVRASVSAGMDFHAAYHGVDSLEDIHDLPRVRRQDPSVDNLLKADSMLKKWKPSSWEHPAPVTEVSTEVSPEVKTIHESIHEYIADYFSRYKQPEEDFLAWDVARRFSIPSSKAEELIADFKARRKAQPAPRRAEMEPERTSTCTCPLCGRSGADRNQILMKTEDPDIAQLTLIQFIKEAL